MTLPYDLWALAGLLAGHDLGVELEAVSERFRPLAAHLNSLPREARGAAWDAFLAARPDRDAINTAVADADPEGPPHEADEDVNGDECADGWEPIVFGSLPPAEPFPLEVLCAPARALIESGARSISCPVDFLAVALLAAASGLIGRSVLMRVKAGYAVPASLYAALVGSPSRGKSPALRAALAPLWRLATRLHAQWRAAMDAWEQAKPDERGEPPELRRLISTDPTTEALGPILAANPRGVTVAPDEMTKWVMSMDQCKGGKGGDRPFYLSVWGGEAVFIDRAKHMREPIAVPHPFLTVIGGMTPDMLSTLPEGKGRNDGFMARLLFCFPERINRRYSEEGIPEAVADDWDRLARALWEIEPRDEAGGPAPHVIRMTPEAARAWTAWCQAHFAEQEADGFPESMEGPWGKLEDYAARLALILHMMNTAADATRPAGDDLPDLPRRVIDDAARLVTYFKSHARRVYATMAGETRDGGGDVRALVRWIVRNDLTHFSTRDIGRNFDRFKEDPAALGVALDWMIAHHMIRPQIEPESPHKSGHKPAPVFDVNPSLKTSPR